MAYLARTAEKTDIPAITDIYNQGIQDRVATFETALSTVEERVHWLLERSEKHKVLVIGNGSGEVYGWASLNVYNSKCCYSGTADVSIYIRRDMRGKGLGKLLMNSLIKEAVKQGFHKLILMALASNEMGKRLYVKSGFREVGVFEKHGQLDGMWLDVVIMEKLL
ncbi:MAG: arsinothricin resistance N-acetyltransferase ArsN1 [Clostridia bacterium]|nr:arsinothricin resistance N-acetyltransferase ArsN1 [Clostridia bacterium]